MIGSALDLGSAFLTPFIPVSNFTLVIPLLVIWPSKPLLFIFLLYVFIKSNIASPSFKFTVLNPNPTKKSWKGFINELVLFLSNLT